MGKFYQNRYAIGLYKIIGKKGDVDELVAIFDNPKEFAKYIQKKVTNATAILRNHLERKDKVVRIGSHSYEIAFIDMQEGE